MLNNKWVENPTNSLLKLEDKYDTILSYNANTTDDLGGFGAGDTINETAICFTLLNTRMYLILNGDWREELQDLTLEECIKVYLENKEQQSSWSTDVKIEQLNLINGG